MSRIEGKTRPIRRFGFWINRGNQTCKINWNQLVCQKQAGGQYTLGNMSYNGEKTKTEGCVDPSKKNALWIKDLAFCNRVKSGSFKGYDGNWAINRNAAGKKCRTP